MKLIVVKIIIMKAPYIALLNIKYRFTAKYLFVLGTTPGNDDVVANTVLSYHVTSHCVDGLQLQHRRVYYSSVTAVNGGLVEKNVTVHSDGGTITTNLLMKTSICGHASLSE